MCSEKKSLMDVGYGIVQAPGVPNPKNHSMTHNKNNNNCNNNNKDEMEGPGDFQGSSVSFELTLFVFVPTNRSVA